jgi:hypothetical protein
MEQHPPTPTDIQAGYETSDVHPRGVVMLGAALLVVTVGASLLLFWLFGLLEQRASQADPPISPLAGETEPAHGPYLEKNYNYRDFQRDDEQKLQSYGWVDKAQKTVHVPIERAMHLIVEENEKR